MYDEELAPLGRIAMDRAEVALGEQVLDVGCGMGHTSLELAERVGSDGSVFAVDIAVPMIERAQQRHQPHVELCPCGRCLSAERH